MTPGAVDPRVFNVNHIIICLDLHFVSVQHFFLYDRHWRRRKTRVRRALRSLNNPEVLLLSLSSPLLEGFLLNIQHLPSQETERQYHFVFSRSLSVLHVPCTQPTWIITTHKGCLWYRQDNDIHACIGGLMTRVQWTATSSCTEQAWSIGGTVLFSSLVPRPLSEKSSRAIRSRSVTVKKVVLSRARTIYNYMKVDKLIPELVHPECCFLTYRELEKLHGIHGDSRKARKLLLILKKKGSLATCKLTWDMQWTSSLHVSC